MSTRPLSRPRATETTRPPWVRRGAVSLLLAISLIGFLGAHHWRFDLAANLRLQLAIAAGFMLGVLVWRRDRWGAAVAALTLAVNAFTLAPIFVGEQPAPANDADTLRVVSFNLFQRNGEADAVVETLTAVEADVIFLQELSRPMRRALDADLGGYHFLTPDPGRFPESTAALVRAGLEATADEVRVSRFEHFPVVRLTYAGAELELVGIHPLSPINESRSAARDRALEQVAAWAATRPGEVVVAGDFNATPFSHGYRTFAENSGLRSTLDGAGWQPTWPDAWSSLLQVPIDHVFVSDGLTPVARTIGPNAGSDHAPVIVDLAPTA